MAGVFYAQQIYTTLNGSVEYYMLFQKDPAKYQEFNGHNKENTMLCTAYCTINVPLNSCRACLTFLARQLDSQLGVLDQSCRVAETAFARTEECYLRYSPNLPNFFGN